ncbi:MAG: hypothetical protein ACRD1C_09020 [Terriglobales bacterium]
MKTALLLLTLSLAAWANPKATYVRPVMQTIPAAGIRQIVVQNMVGPISVKTDVGPSIALVVLIHSGGNDATFAQALSQQLQFSIQNDNGQLRVIGEYPLDHFRNYGYPNMKSIIGIHGTDSNVYQGKKVFIRDVNSSKVVDLWAEIRLTAPPGIEVVVRNTYGNVTLHGGDPITGGSSFDGFTDVGDFKIYRPQWQSLKIQNDYGDVDFSDGLGSARDIRVKIGNVGSTSLALPPGADPTIIAHKDLGFLHNDITEASFVKNSQGDSVLKLGDGKGATVTIDMSVGSLHLIKAGGIAAAGSLPPG